METTVRRVTPSDSAAVVALPLIKGESVLTGGIAVKEGAAELIFSQRTDYLRFTSSLAIAPRISLTHAKTDLYSETWRIAPSSIWHIEYLGPPVISHQQGNRWLPTWKPWPGESVTLTITRPKTVPGPVKTIDRSRLTVEPGRTATNVSLTMTMRSSQGGQHSIKISPTAEAIRTFEINGRNYPIQKDPSGRLVFPVTPGQQDIRIEWTESAPMRVHYATPIIDLGLESVNSELAMTMGQDRWPLVLWGPRMGPAVLWWSFVVITFLASLGLARIRMVPLTLWQWFLLGIGLMQTNIFLPLVFVLWLIALGKRGELTREPRPWLFNLIQFSLVLLTLAAIAALVTAISNGLLGYPDMQIIGNGSSNFLFQWYRDVAATILPTARVISLPLWVYRLLMLLWALWISFTLVRLLIWGWHCFSAERIWISTPIRLRREKKSTGQEKAEPPTS